jgi:hypothetical protein
LDDRKIKFESLEEPAERRSRGARRADSGIEEQLENGAPEREGGSGSPHGRRPLMLAAGLFLIVVLGVTAAMRISAAKKQREAEEAASIEASIAAEEAAARERENRIETVPFAPCEVPELDEAARSYFDAKLKGDTASLQKMFGKEPEEDPELAVKLKTQADWIQGYQDIEVFCVPGRDENSKLCLVKYQIDFRRTDTLAPGILYFYARRNPEGGYTFIDKPVNEIYEYIQAELETDSAKRLIADSNQGLKAALDSDSTLALIYTSFRSGEIYRDTSLEMDKEQEVDLFLDPEDSILVDDAVLEEIQNEAAEEASIEASLAAEDET